MWERLRSIWTVPDLRNKILFTLGMLLIFRVLASITVPLTHAQAQALAKLFSGSSNNNNLGQLLGLLDVFSGGSLQTFSIVALSVYPYITATIVMQLLQPIIPALQNLSMQGEAGRLRFSQITRMITVPLAFLQALGQCAIFQKANVLTNFSLVDPNYALETYAILITLTAGTMILMWLGELITEKGIGNGVSLIIFAGIVGRAPQAIGTFLGNPDLAVATAFLVIAVAVVAVIVFVQEGQRRIPIQYASRVRGRRIYQGGQTYLPLRVNMAGVIPIIFAVSILLFPSQIASYFTSSKVSIVADISRG